jgi:hypothetical protein
MSDGHLFSFYNAFDNVTIGFDDATHDSTGPFTVSKTFDSPEISTDNESFEYTKLADAKDKFLELVGIEFDAVVSQGDREVILLPST